MKKLKIIFNSLPLAFCVIIYGSCKPSGPKIEDVDEPREMVTLVHQVPQQLKGVETSAIGIVDSTLMVVNNSGKAVLSFYALSDLRKLADFGNLEDKQGILVRPKYSNQYLSNKGDTEFFIADTKRHNLLRYSLTDVLTDSNARPLWQMYLPPAIASSYVSVFVAPDTTIFGNQFGDGKGRGRFFRYDPKTDKVLWTPYFPKVDARIPDKDLSTYYYSQCAYNQSEGTMISAMYLFKRIDVIAASNMATKAAVFRKHRQEVPAYQPDGERNNPQRYYSFVFGGSNYFFAYCINSKQSDYLGNVGNMEVHVFTWDGRLKNIFRLDRMHLGRFVVDEQRHVLYAVNYGQDKSQHPILSYDLKQILL